jgi:hypothetical protein
LYCISGSFTGVIHAEGGSIGDWSIGEQSLSFGLKYLDDPSLTSGFYLNSNGLRFVNYDKDDDEFTEWYVDGNKKAMLWKAAKSFPNVWADKNAYKKLNINASLDKDGIVFYLTNSLEQFYFGS